MRSRWIALFLLPLTLGLGPPESYRLQVETPSLEGETPSLEGEADVPENHLVRVHLAGTFSEADWSVEPESVADVEIGPDGRSLVFTGPSGRYVIDTFWVDWEARTKGRVSRVFVIRGNPRPDPGPQPDPNPPPLPPLPPEPEPPPEPDILAGPLHILYLTDVDDLDPAAGLVRGSVTIRESLDALDAKWRWFDDDDPSEPGKSWIAWWARNDGGVDPNRVEVLPALLVVRPDATVVLKLSQPAGATIPPAVLRSEEGIINTVKALRGVP